MAFMQRTITKLARHEQPARDLAYWLSRPVAERIAAVELLWRDAHVPLDNPDAEPRLQRICRVLDRRGR
jgi:hypothetical protein